MNTPAPSEHSKLPPSGAFRWLDCTASVKFVEDNKAVLPEESSEFADEGTRAHAYLTACLKHTLGQVPDNEEMKVIIGALVEYIHSLIRPGDALLVDQKVSLFYLLSDTGTLDVAIVSDDRIVVLDLKYGAGVSVYAVENEQLIIYAESKIRELEQAREFAGHTKVHLIIYQPRDRNDPQVVREWVISRNELAMRAMKIHAIAQQVLLERDLQFSPGRACKFCRAEGICTAKGTTGLEVISDEPVDVVLAKPVIAVRDNRVVTRAQRQKILAAKKDMIAFLEAVENQEVAELLNGAAPLQYKLVEGKSNRQWADEKAVKALLATVILPDEICPPKAELISPKQAEDVLKTVAIPGDKTEFMAKLLALITKPAGKPTLVPIEDGRPALVLNPTEGLSKISEYDPKDLI